MKFFLVLTLVFPSLFNIAYAETLVSTWETTFGELTITQEGNQTTGHYTFGGGSSTVGEMKETSEGLELHGYWQESNGLPHATCGPDGDWSGSYVFRFSDDKKSFIGDWSGCEEDKENLNPEDNSWSGELISGKVGDLEGCTSPETSTVSLDLGIHMPFAIYQSLAGEQEIWVELKYAGQNTDGKPIWVLDEFGPYIDTCP